MEQHVCVSTLVHVPVHCDTCGTYMWYTHVRQYPDRACIILPSTNKACTVHVCICINHMYTCVSVQYLYMYLYLVAEIEDTLQEHLLSHNIVLTRQPDPHHQLHVTVEGCRDEGKSLFVRCTLKRRRERG